MPFMKPKTLWTWETFQEQPQPFFSFFPFLYWKFTSFERNFVPSPNKRCRASNGISRLWQMHVLYMITIKRCSDLRQQSLFWGVKLTFHTSFPSFFSMILKASMRRKHTNERNTWFKPDWLLISLIFAFFFLISIFFKNCATFSSHTKKYVKVHPVVSKNKIHLGKLTGAWQCYRDAVMFWVLRMNITYDNTITLLPPSSPYLRKRKVSQTLGTGANVLFKVQQGVFKKQNKKQKRPWSG